MLRLPEFRYVKAGSLKESAEATARAAHPVDNADMDYWYRKRMTKVYVRRARPTKAQAFLFFEGP